MAHVPEEVEQFVCAECQVTHAGTPIHEDAGDHSFEAPTTCGACGADEFVAMSDWIRHHD
jgi:hypothetical protein